MSHKYIHILIQTWNQHSRNKTTSDILM